MFYYFIINDSLIGTYVTDYDMYTKISVDTVLYPLKTSGNQRYLYKMKLL